MVIEKTELFDERLQELLDIMARAGISQAAQGFAGMIGRPLTVSQPQVRLVRLEEVPNMLGGPENEAVGIYLRAQGEMPGQLMLVLAYDKALELVDLLLTEPTGTTQALGRMERSALAELGNLTGTFFLNAVTAFAGFGARPTPPAVMVDMVGAILDIVVATHGGAGQHVLMLQVAFMDEARTVQADFWVIPDPEALEAFARRKANHAG
jgi:chemotaxis protein CheC